MAGEKILLVDDEPNSLFVTSQILMEQSYQVITADNGMEALNKLKAEKINVVITDERMPDISGMEVLSEIKKYDARIPVIILTGYGTIPLAINALRNGAFYFFEKPISHNLDQFYHIIEEAVKAQMLHEEAREQRGHDETSGMAHILGKNKKMLDFAFAIRFLSFANTRFTQIITYKLLIANKQRWCKQFFGLVFKISAIGF